MDGNLTIVIVVGLICLTAAGIGYLMYLENTNQSDLETCMEECDQSYDLTGTFNCQKECINNIEVGCNG